MVTGPGPHRSNGQRRGQQGGGVPTHRGKGGATKTVSSRLAGRILLLACRLAGEQQLLQGPALAGRPLGRRLRAGGAVGGGCGARWRARRRPRWGPWPSPPPSPWGTGAPGPPSPWPWAPGARPPPATGPPHRGYGHWVPRPPPRRGQGPRRGTRPTRPGPGGPGCCGRRWWRRDGDPYRIAGGTGGTQDTMPSTVPGTSPKRGGGAWGRPKTLPA